MSANERRALAFGSNPEHNSSISYDVNEYLIEAWPTLPARGRKAVWTLAQNDEEFDFSSIEEQIDQHVWTFSETDPTWTAPESDEEYEEDEEESLYELGQSIRELLLIFLGLETEEEDED